MAFIGISAKTPEAVNTWGFMIILPLTFVSSAFVPTSSMPGWLEAFANVNPITKVINAMRGLMLDNQFAVAKPLLQSIAWIAAIVAVFAPLTIAKYRRRV
jgi:ABC-type multidrug transport system permease subunit